MKILIAEDEPVTRRLLQSYLERWGHEVVAAENGAEAWRAFQAQHFPIVISDWVMPEMDGLELIRRVREHGRSDYVYAILLTAKSQKEDIVEGMESGADDFVTKPFDRDELRVRLRAGERIVRLEEMLAERLHELRAVDAVPRQVHWPGLTSALTIELEEVIAQVTAELAEIRSQLPPARPTDPVLADALDRLARVRARLATLAASAEPEH